MQYLDVAKNLVTIVKSVFKHPPVSIDCIPIRLLGLAEVILQPIHRSSLHRRASHVVEMEAPTQEFLFVPTSGLVKPKNSPRRRSHAMRQALKTAKSRSIIHAGLGPVQRTKAQGQTKFRVPLDRSKPNRPAKTASDPVVSSNQSGSLPCIPPSETPLGTDSPPKTTGLSKMDVDALLRLSMSPLRFFGSSKFDVFDVLPVKLSPLDDQLLSRFSHYQKWPWCPISGQTLWAPFAVSDKMIFSATMYSWAMAFRSHLTGSQAAEFLESNKEVLQHKVTAITLLNENIRDPTRASTDTTIAAVAALTNLELVYGSPQSTSNHMTGLRALVALHGGMPSFTTPLQQLIQRLIGWSDLVYAGIYQTPLYFEPIELWDISWRTADQFSVPGSPLCLAPPLVKAHGIPQREVIDLLESTRQLCTLEQSHPLSRCTDRNRMHRADMCMGLEARLTRIIHSTTITAATSTSNQHAPQWPRNLWRSTSLAALIFIQHFLRGAALRAPQFGVWAHLLREALSSEHQHGGTHLGELAFSRSLLLWVLCVGGVAARGEAGEAGEDRRWFELHLRRACARYAIGWWELLQVLRGFVWTGEGDEEKYLSLKHSLR